MSYSAVTLWIRTRPRTNLLMMMMMMMLMVMMMMMITRQMKDGQRMWMLLVVGSPN